MSKLCVAGLAVVLLAPVVALPVQAAGPRPVALTETVTLETSHSGTLDVSLPDDARVSVAAASTDVAFEGAGRLVGIWLQRPDHTGDYLVSYRLPSFAGGQQVSYGSVPAPNCAAVPADALPVTYDCSKATFSHTAVLHQGRYRLTVLADGSPLRVTLRLHGLDAGELTVAPQRQLASTEQVLPVRETGGDRFVTFGRSAAIGVPAQTFIVATAKGSGGSTVKESSFCVQPGDTQVPLAYGPPCPGGAAGAFDVTIGSDVYAGHAFVTSGTWDDAGPIGLGGSFGDSDGLTFGQALGVWLART